MSQNAKLDLLDLERTITKMLIETGIDANDTFVANDTCEECISNGVLEIPLDIHIYGGFMKRNNIT
jgi:hypothetical protein